MCSIPGSQAKAPRSGEEESDIIELKKIFLGLQNNAIKIIFRGSYLARMLPHKIEQGLRAIRWPTVSLCDPLHLYLTVVLLGPFLKHIEVMSIAE